MDVYGRSSNHSTITADGTMVTIIMLPREDTVRSTEGNNGTSGEISRRNIVCGQKHCDICLANPFPVIPAILDSCSQLLFKNIMYSIPIEFLFRKHKCCKCLLYSKVKSRESCPIFYSSVREGIPSDFAKVILHQITNNPQIY